MTESLLERKRSVGARSLRGIVAAALAVLLIVPVAAQAERIKDLEPRSGVRSSQLAGYGPVVGLDGTGDQTTQSPFTVQSIRAMLSAQGVTIPSNVNLQLKNVAAVMVTAELPPFAKPGQTIDVTVSSLGNAKSLRGGTLLMTPLKGANGTARSMPWRRAACWSAASARKAVTAPGLLSTCPLPAPSPTALPSSARC